MKKLLTFVLLMCLSMVALTGCGSNKGKLATEKEINAFIKEHKMSDVLKKEINFTFSYEYKSEENYLEDIS